MLSARAIPRPAMANPVPWSGEVRRNGSPRVTFHQAACKIYPHSQGSHRLCGAIVQVAGELFARFSKFTLELAALFEHSGKAISRFCHRRFQQ